MCIVTVWQTRHYYIIITVVTSGEPKHGLALVAVQYGARRSPHFIGRGRRRVTSCQSWRERFPIPEYWRIGRLPRPGTSTDNQCGWGTIGRWVSDAAHIVDHVDT